MNKNWFEVTLVCSRMDESGVEREVKEKYLVGAESVSDAEKRAVEELAPFITREFEVSDVTKKKIAEVMTDGKERIYKAKVMFITLDEKSGKEKKTASTIIVDGDGFKEAYDRLLEGMKGTIADWELHTLQESAYVDILHHEV